MVSEPVVPFLPCGKRLLPPGSRSVGYEVLIIFVISLLQGLPILSLSIAAAIGTAQPSRAEQALLPRVPCGGLLSCILRAEHALLPRM